MVLFLICSFLESLNKASGADLNEFDSYYKTQLNNKVSSDIETKTSKANWLSF